MLSVPHWEEARQVTLAQSRSGTRVVSRLRDNFVYPIDAPWPPHELRPKMRRGRFAGATSEDDRLATEERGYYCPLQSLNSEDAVTWSVFGTLKHLVKDKQVATIGQLFDALNLPRVDAEPAFSFWPRVQHPDTAKVSHGPEIDTLIVVGNWRVLVESKWGSGIDRKQGAAGNTNQIQIRADYCDRFGRKEHPIAKWLVLGIGPTSSVFPTVGPPNDSTAVASVAWSTLFDCMPSPYRDKLGAYSRWRLQFAKA
jgi:hypothetical protein